MGKKVHTARDIHSVKPSRLFDYLYDPSYILSCHADHTRTDELAHQRFKCVPIWQTMFTDLHRFRRMYRELDTLDHVPPFVPRDWRDYEAIARETLRPCQNPIVPVGVSFEQVFPCTNTAGDLSDSIRESGLCGGSWKHEHRVQVDDPSEVPFGHGIHHHRTTRSVKTQTIKRDSETQTDPYSPPCKGATRPPGSHSELLHLTHFSYGHGLPAGLAEVYLIEQARQRRAFEATLPPKIDAASVDINRRAFVELETCKWATRAQVIVRLKDMKMQTFLQLLKEHQLASLARINEGMDLLWDDTKKNKLIPKINQIRTDCQRAIRVMMRRADHIETKAYKRDVIGEHADLGSQVFAPLTRVGFFPERNCNQNRIDPRLLDTYDGLLELEQWLPACLLEPCIKRPENKTRTKKGYLLSKFLYDKHLGEVYELLHENRIHPPGPPKESRLKEYKDKMRDRAVTPTVHRLECYEMEAAVTLLQSLIRGRAVQNTMYEVKEERIDLIEELKSTHAMWSSLRIVKQEHKEAVLRAQVEQHNEIEKDSYCSEILEGLNAANLGELLDFTTKELNRLVDEQRLHAMAMLIERQRRMREAEEAGERHIEERRRREEDEIFKNVVKVHETTIDAYLTDVVLSSLEREANEVSRLEVQQLATKIDRIAADLIESTASECDGRQQATLEHASVVTELVYGFLIPEVAKQEFRERVHMKQRSSLFAAHREIFDSAQVLLADDTLIDRTMDFETPLPEPCDMVPLAELTRLFPDLPR